MLQVLVTVSILLPPSSKMQYGIQLSEVRLFAFSLDTIPSYIYLETTTSLPNRAKRLQDTSAEIEKLYQRNTTNTSFTSRRGNAASAPRFIQRPPNDRPAAIDARNLGAPLSREVLEAGLAQPSRKNSRNEDRRTFPETDGARDARSLGTRPAGAVQSGGFTMRRTAARDARGLGAVPNEEERIGRFTMGKAAPKEAGRSGIAAQGAPKSGGFTISKDYSDAPANGAVGRPETTGLQERQRFPPRAPGRDFGQGGGQPLRRPGTENSIRERAPRLGADRPPRPARDGGGTNRRTPRAKGSQARRGGGSGRGRGDRGPPVDVWSAQEKEYFEEKREREAPKVKDFDPKLPQADLNNVRPAMMSGPGGMGALLGDRLLLARKLLNNEIIIWESKEQKADVTTLAEILKAERQAKSTQEGADKTTTLSGTQAQTDALMQKLWGGKYELVRPKQEKDIIGHVARQADRNESYYPEDEESLLEKIRNLLPAEQARNVGKLKTAVK